MRVNVSMKHPGEYSAWDYCLRQRKRLKHATLPRSLCALPHVMKRIDLFAMSLEDAAVEAAATNDIDRLRSILDHIKINEYRDDVGRDGTDVAAAKGYTEIIKLISADSYAPTELCKLALTNAVNGGHLEAIRALLSNWHWVELVNSRWGDDDVEHPYNFDLLEALEAAVTKGEYNISRGICEHNKIPGKIFLWAAEHDDLDVFDDVYYFHHLDDMDNLYRAMLVAVSRGCLDIVKFVIDKCGAELLDYVYGDDTIKHSQSEVMEYLYAHDTGCEDDTHAVAFCAAAAYGPLEMVKMIYDNDNEKL
ncbi:Ankyrin repeat-containing domain [Phytophthora cactorum]|nr:Ankyrin repeat-containing domain [Phytophthora cactorum]